MKQLLLIHPLGQLVALMFGVYNIICGLSRRSINRALHLNAGVLYYALGIMGAGIGALMAAYARQQGLVCSPTVHKWSGVVLALLFAAGATSGLQLLHNQGHRTRLLRVHRWANVAGLCLFGVQAGTGLAVLVSLI